MEVILHWTALGSRFRFEPMDDVAEKDLNDVEDEEYESESLSHGLNTHKGERGSVMAYRVRASEVRATTVGDDRNAKCPSNDDDGSGKEGLDSLMSLEPGTC